MKHKNSKPSTISNLKRSFWICFKTTVIFGLFFMLVFQQFTAKGIGYTFLISAMFSYGLGFGNAFLNDFLNSKWDWITQTNKRIIAGIIGTILYTIPVVLAINYFIFVVLNERNSDSFFKGNMIWMNLFWILFALAISTFFHARGFMIRWKESASKESTKQEIVAKTETAKFESLKGQIDPHFLFNSLNVLASLIGENPKKAELFTTKLSKIYRYVLEQRDKDLIPLSEELLFAKTYIELLQMRFEDAIEFEILTTVRNDELKIVPLSLQLLLENAVKHNVLSSEKPLILKIFEEDESLIIENNISLKETIGKSTKVGLKNITDRYKLLTKRSVSIVNDKKTFKVILPLLTKNSSIMHSEDIKNSKYVKAVRKVEKLKEFYQNIASYCIIIPVLIFINLKFLPYFHWFWFPVVGWGIGILFHGLDTYDYNPFLGANWEERKIKELMKKEENKSN